MNDHIAGVDLAAYVDGLLKGGPKAGIESHLSRCRECREALAEIVDIQGSAEKIPGDFLNRALGGKPGSAKTLPPMRLVFGIAAVFLVVVVIGYYFLDNGRVKTAERVGKEMAQPAVAAQKQRFPAQDVAAGKGWQMEKKSAAAKAEAARPAAPPAAEAVEPATLPGKAERLQSAGEKDLMLPREAEDGAFGGVLGGVEAPLAKDKENAMKLAAAPAAPAARAEKLGESDGRIFGQAAAAGAARYDEVANGEQEPQRSRPEAASFIDGPIRVFLAASGRAAAPLGISIHPLVRHSAIRIEGDVSWADLRDPGLLLKWRWLKKGMALELTIDADGAVSAVSLLGHWDRPAAARAEQAARELLFSVSEKTVRRAVLAIPETPVN